MNHDPDSTSPLALVVNDDFTQRRVLCALLTKAGVDARGFSGAEAALDALTSLPVPDLVVTDLYMPGIDGWRFCSLLRSPQYAALNRVPIMVVSATFAGDETSRLTSELGADDFMAAPVDGPAFVSRVRALLSGSGGAEAQRVLIVESDPVEAERMRRAFEAHGYRTTVVSDNGAATAELERQAIDLAVVDLLLDGEPGDRLLEVLKNRHSGCVSVMIAGKEGTGRTLDWLRQGAAACLLRPFDLDYLVEVCTRARRERALLRVQDLLEDRTRELRRSEDRLQLALSAAELGTWDYDIPRGTFTFDPRWAAMAGLGAGSVEMSFDDWKARIHPEDLDQLVGSLERPMQGHLDVVNIEYRFRHQSGEWIWLQGRGRITDWDSAGRPLRACGTAMDVTARKAMEESIRRHAIFREGLAECLTTLAEPGPDTERLASLLDRLARITGSKVVSLYTLEPGPDGSQRLALQDLQIAAEGTEREVDAFVMGPMSPESPWLQQALRSGRAAVCRASELPPAERTLLSMLHSRNLLVVPILAGGTVWGCFRFDDPEFLGDFRDEGLGLLQSLADSSGAALVRGRMQAELEEREEFLRAVLETTADGFWMADSTGRLQNFNDAYCRMSGFSREELEGSQVADRDLLESPEETAERIRYIRAHGSMIFETKHRRKDGSSFDAEVSVTALPHRGGTMVCFCRDISERKQAEAEQEIVLTLLTHLNQPDGAHGLMRNVANLMRDWSGCEAVGIRLQQGEDYPYFETSGFPGSFVAKENRLCALDARGRTIRDAAGNAVLECMCGNVIQGRTNPELPFFTPYGSFWSNSTSALLASTTEQDRQARTRNRCNGEGYESVALIPLRQGGRTHGLLQFNDKRPGRFTEAKVRLLERLAANLAIGLAQRQTAEELRTSEERLRLALKASNDVIWDWDVNRDELSWSEAGATVFGWDEIVDAPQSGPWWSSRIHPDDAPRVVKCFSRTLADSATSTWRDEYRFRKADGTYALVLDRGHVVRAADGRPVRMIGAMLDITERTRVAEERARQAGLISSLLDSIPDLIFYRDREGVYLGCNQAFAEHLGLSPEEIVGRTNADLYPQAELELFSWTDLRVMESLEPCRYEEWITYPDGRKRRGETLKTPYLGDDGTVLGVIGIIRDITERKQAEEDLRKFRSIAELATYGAAIADLDGNVVWLNEIFARMHGLEPRDFLGSKLTVFHNEEQLLRVATLNTQLLEIGAFTNEEVWHVRRDGSTFPTLMNGALIPDELGRPQFFSATAIDISEMKAAQGALRESEELYRTLINGIPDVVSRLDRAGRLLFISPNAEEVLGIPSSRLIGRTLRESGFATPWGERAVRELDAVLENGEPREWEASVDVEGETRNLSIRLLPEGDPSGEVRSVLMISRDITAARKAERDYQTLFREMLDGLVLQRIVRGPDGSPQDYLVLAVNPAFERIFERDAGQIIGRNVSELIPKEDRQWFDELDRVVKAGLPGRLEGRTRLGRYIEITAFAPGPEEVACIITDITARKAAEVESARMQEQLIQAQKMESVGRLAGGVAHDFNNMLGVILGHTEMAQEGLDPRGPLYSDLEEIRQAAQRSADLTRQLLAFARKQTVTPKVLDLNDTVEGMLKMLQRLIGENIRLEWNPGTSLWPLRLDPGQLDQILANLCVNARDAIAGVGKITIRTANQRFDGSPDSGAEAIPPGEYVELAVSDTGSGMSAEVLEHLFEPFFTTKPVGQGTGLGLATVYGIVRQNQGQIRVSSEPGKGSSFSILFPRFAGKESATGLGEAKAEGKRGHETILLVEDEAAILGMARRMLEGLGYRVLAAGSPVIAIRMAEEFPGTIDLLMTDVIMPELNGKDLARRILNLYPNMKRLFTSGYTADVIAHHGIVEEGVPFIQKPFSRADLGAKIRAVLDSD